MRLIDNALDKLPYVQKLRWVIERLKDEIRARDEFGDKLIDENEKLTAECKRLTESVAAMQNSEDTWHKRWEDEHEKYVDLCEQLRESMEKLKDAANMVISTTMIDT